MHFEAARDAVALKLARPLTEEDWATLLDFAWGAEEPPTDFSDDDVELMVSLAARAAMLTRSLATRRQPDEGPRGGRYGRQGPPWWQKYTRRPFLRDDQPQLHRFALGLEAPLAPEEIGTFLVALERMQRVEGESVRLEYPTPVSPYSSDDMSAFPVPMWHTDSILVHRGWSLLEIDEESVRRVPSVRGLGDMVTHKDAATLTQPLWRFAAAAHAIAHLAGCSEAEAVAYLLSDVPLEPPYIEVDTRSGYFGSQAVIFVGSTRVSADDVREAYVEWRKFVSRLFRDDKPQRRHPREKTLALVDYVERRKASGTKWADMFEEWDAEHPGQYRSLRSMQQAYYRAVRDWGSL